MNQEDWWEETNKMWAGLAPPWEDTDPGNWAQQLREQSEQREREQREREKREKWDREVKETTEQVMASLVNSIGNEIENKPRKDPSIPSLKKQAVAQVTPVTPDLKRAEVDELAARNGTLLNTRVGAGDASRTSTVPIWSPSSSLTLETSSENRNLLPAFENVPLRTREEMEKRARAKREVNQREIMRVRAEKERRVRERVKKALEMNRHLSDLQQKERDLRLKALQTETEYKHEVELLELKMFDTNEKRIIAENAQSKMQPARDTMNASFKQKKEVQSSYDNSFKFFPSTILKNATKAYDKAITDNAMVINQFAIAEKKWKEALYAEKPIRDRLDKLSKDRARAKKLANDARDEAREAFEKTMEFNKKVAASFRRVK